MKSSRRSAVESAVNDNDQFWQRVAKGEVSECWRWLGPTNNKGYGTFRGGKNKVLAHRVAFFLTHGLFDERLFVCHVCDNPPCCNPSHMFLGTQSDNMLDMYRKGRWTATPASGERHPNAKLTDEAVREIRTRALTYSAYAKKFRVPEGTIGFVLNGSTWSRVR